MFKEVGYKTIPTRILIKRGPKAKIYTLPNKRSAIKSTDNDLLVELSSNSQKKYFKIDVEDLQYHIIVLMYALRGIIAALNNNNEKFDKIIEYMNEDVAVTLPEGDKGGKTREKYEENIELLSSRFFNVEHNPDFLLDTNTFDIWSIQDELYVPLKNLVELHADHEIISNYAHFTDSDNVFDLLPEDATFKDYSDHLHALGSLAELIESINK